MIKACIFDLDGVVVDTAKYHFIAWRELAKGMNFEFTEKDNERLKGVSRMTSLDILLEIGNVSLSQEEKLALAEQKNVEYLEYIYKMGPEEILPGVKDFILDLRAKGIKIALGSASKNAKLILERLEITSLFDALVDGTMVSNAKPDPQVFTLGAELLEVANEECIVFEDAVAGLQAAHNANMKCVGVGDTETLSEADWNIEGFENIKPEAFNI
ncbi:MAG: beta-phosphoglucomutase [Marinifilaceae bacterium]